MYQFLLCSAQLTSEFLQIGARIRKRRTIFHYICLENMSSSIKLKKKIQGRHTPQDEYCLGRDCQKKSKLTTFSTSSQTTLLVHNVLCCAYVPVVYITAMSPCTANTCVYLSIDRYTYITIYMCISIYIYTRVQIHIYTHTTIYIDRYRKFMFQISQLKADFRGWGEMGWADQATLFLH